MAGRGRWRRREGLQVLLLMLLLNEQQGCLFLCLSSSLCECGLKCWFLIVTHPPCQSDLFTCCDDSSNNEHQMRNWTASNFLFKVPNGKKRHEKTKNRYISKICQWAPLSQKWFVLILQLWLFYQNLTVFSVKWEKWGLFYFRQHRVVSLLTDIGKFTFFALTFFKDLKVQ